MKINRTKNNCEFFNTLCERSLNNRNHFQQNVQTTLWSRIHAFTINYSRWLIELFEFNKRLKSQLIINRIINSPAVLIHDFKSISKASESKGIVPFVRSINAVGVEFITINVQWVVRVNHVSRQTVNISKDLSISNSDISKDIV